MSSSSSSSSSEEEEDERVASLIGSGVSKLQQMFQDQPPEGRAQPPPPPGAGETYPIWTGPSGDHLPNQPPPLGPHSPKRSKKHKKKSKLTSEYFTKQPTMNQRLYSDMEDWFRLHYTDVIQPCLKRRIDYVLVYDNPKEDLEYEEFQKSRTHFINRKKFEEKLREEGFTLEYHVIGEFTYITLSCSFVRLCLEAERTKLEVPLAGKSYNPPPMKGCLGAIDSCIEDMFVTDNELDYVSAPFDMDKGFLFEGFDQQNRFFKPGTRSLLVHNILINTDIRDKADVADERLKVKGLPYLLHISSYADAFILHEESSVDNRYMSHAREMGVTVEPLHKETSSSSTDDLNMDELGDEYDYLDERRDLTDTWTRMTKFQPLWKVRNYFGEKVAFYFAWIGTLVASLWVPTILGVIVFIVGLYKSVEKEILLSSNSTLSVTELSETALIVVNSAFDNEVTPFFALIICLWGTIFMEVWKRRSATLAFEWDVDSFEEAEPDRPQFMGTAKTIDPVTNEEIWYYPFSHQLPKIIISTTFTIFMVMLVLISVVAVVVYRLVISSLSLTGVEDIFLNTLMSSVLNAISIQILGFVYRIIAYKLNAWENHRTQSAHEDALLIKLFAFQFVNSYSSLYYIAFFRGQSWAMSNGIFNMGTDYIDTCDLFGSSVCMLQLSFQVMTLMIMKPLPKLCTDIIIPWIKGHIKTYMKQRENAKVSPEEEARSTKPITSKEVFLDFERNKADVGDFTLAEYNEKIIMYGYQMLFAASFPLAPLISLLTNFFDIRVDAGRLLWLYRRPVASMAQDIGMWENILDFINVVGVITNAFLIAFTSTSFGETFFGDDWTLKYQLLTVIVFEHMVFGIKFIISYAIPDVPREISLAQRKEKYELQNLLEEATLNKGLKKEIVKLYKRWPCSSDLRSVFRQRFVTFQGTGDGSPCPDQELSQDVTKIFTEHEI